MFPSPVQHGAPTTAQPVRVPNAAFRDIGVFAQEEWRVTPRLNLSYAVRADRYDYLQVPNVYSGSAEVRALLEFLERSTRGIVR